MGGVSITLTSSADALTFMLSGSLTLASLGDFEKRLLHHKYASVKIVHLELDDLEYIDTAAALFINTLKDEFRAKGILFNLLVTKKNIIQALELTAHSSKREAVMSEPKENALERIGRETYDNYRGVLGFLAFIGQLFATKIRLLLRPRNIRHKEIAYELYESSIKAIGIVALTSFLIGLVVAYQSAYQLKIYGANIFIVDMLGLPILRELSPLITAIVIAGRSGSAFSAQIGAMKITEELDAMRSMGFDPYFFLVLPKIIALMIAMPIMIFISDIMALFGGMLVANIDLDITVELFMQRFHQVIAAKHFFVGIVKGPFFAFLIASIGIYRGLMVKDDTQSIGFNTTKSVVESIFAVIVCDAIFSIAFTNLGI